jgi:sporulation protein YlmC with PRC-barrel domain
MISKFFATALLTTALASAAIAQTAAPNRTETVTTNVTVNRDGEWRASKLVGVNVYNEANEKIGEINEVILDRSGKVVNVILGIGGFLGMGEHDVAVAFDKLKWVDEPVRAATASNAAGDKPATNVDSTARTASDGNSRATTGSAATTRRVHENWYPDHAVYNATKDQLKSMPQFKY